MRIGCNTVAFRTEPLDTALARIAEAGYEWVEIEGNLKWCPHADPWQEDPIQFADKVRSHGFKGIAALGNHRELITQEQGAKDIARGLEWCREAGIPLVLTGEGRLGPGMTVDEGLAILRDRLSYLAEIAEKNEVYLALEDHGGISLGSLDGLPQIVDLVDSDWLVVNFDTANIHRGDYVGTDREKWEWKLGEATSFSETKLLARLVDRVKHVHFKDVVGRNAVIAGQGEIDLAGCLRLLKQAGFDGVLSYETEGFEEAEEAQKMITLSRQYMLGMLAVL
jgi:sugar phosphate isomerase/epimerase